MENSLVPAAVIIPYYKPRMALAVFVVQAGKKSADPN